MTVRIITLRYDENLQGFPDEPLKKAAAGGAILACREHFYVHGGVPHLTLVLEVDEAVKKSGGTKKASEDAGAALPAHVRPLYDQLRKWRNERSKKDGVPAYVLFRNAELADICRALPRSLAALRQIEGVGEQTCAKYGEELLALIPADLQPGGDE